MNIDDLSPTLFGTSVPIVGSNICHV